MRGADKFPGGRVVTGCFIVLAVSSGLGFYGLAVYLAAFSDERGWPVAEISLATTLYFIVGGVTGLYVARLIARRDVRIPIVGGAIVGGVSLALLGQVTERWQLYAVYAVFALGFAGAGLIPVTTVITRWYHTRRSVALSVASTGLSAGGILLTPGAKWLIDDRGLAASTPILGGVWLVGILPFALWLIRPDPAALGWHPDGERVTGRRRRAEAVRRAVRRGRAQPVLHRRDDGVRAHPRRPGRRHPAARQARRGPHRREHGGDRHDGAGRDVGDRPAGRGPHRLAGAHHRDGLRAGRGAGRCRWR